MDLSANRIMQNDGVKGVLCSDVKGDLYCKRGTMNERTAAIITQISELASQMEPDDPIEPIVSLQSRTSRILIRRYNNLVVGVHKLI
ncbi:Late endosomal/lysosomal adaptor and MAPK and MTOR activator 5 [Aphelenchoides besseyi]|nr:Late endosomal/lysosomal adaptor and MAPK and MTOR activator 5 [Aphelenchoides besseyi]